MIAPLIKWDHTEDYFVTKFSMQKGDYSGERKVTLSLEEESYIAGHIIDGRLLNCSMTFKVYLEYFKHCITVNRLKTENEIKPNKPAPHCSISQVELLYRAPLICN